PVEPPPPIEQMQGIEPVQPPIAAATPVEAPAPTIEPVPATRPPAWRERLKHTTLGEVATAAVLKALMVVGGLVAVLPLLAVIRGTAEVGGRIGRYDAGQRVGLSLALLALLMGAFFFAYSIKYYL